MKEAIAGLVPRDVATSVLADFAAAEEPWPAEEAQLEGAGPARRADFRAGRHCARRALEELGHRPAALLRGEGGAPVWPPGFAGSITHCRGLAAAAVGPRGTWASMGLDVEVRGRATPRLARMIATPAERAEFERRGERGQDFLDLVFSAKEAFYKAQHPCSGAWLGFHDVELTFAEDGGYRLRLGKSVPDLGVEGTEFEGRFVFGAEHVASFVALSSA